MLFRSGSELTTNMQMFLLMTALMFLPTIIFMMTSFVRVIITFSFIKSALGAQQSIPNQILVGLAMCITLFIMSPVMNKVAENSIRPYMNQEITMQEAYDEFKSCKKIVEDIASKDFIQCNKNTVVNRQYIHNIDGTNRYITLVENRGKLEIGPRLKKEFLRRLEND